MTDDSGCNFSEKYEGSCHALSMYCCNTAPTTSAASVIRQIGPSALGWESRVALECFLGEMELRQQVLAHPKGVALACPWGLKGGRAVVSSSQHSVEGYGDRSSPFR